jgi:hypothetical protein
MPLLDHFRPPLSKRRHWDSLHGAWAEAIALHLNQELLPERYYAEARVKFGARVEIDVAAFEEEGREVAHEGNVALWAPPRPAATVALNFDVPDLFEVQIFTDQEGPQLVAAIELVSPANKDRPSNRRMFAVKCASYLQDGVSVMIVDVVTQRKGNLHADLLKLLKVAESVPTQKPNDLYATAYRTRSVGKSQQLDVWAETLTLGNPLPTLPLWIDAERSLPVDLEQSYQTACAARRIG